MRTGVSNRKREQPRTDDRNGRKKWDVAAILIGRQRFGAFTSHLSSSCFAAASCFWGVLSFSSQLQRVFAAVDHEAWGLFGLC
jgi:hypothetical protein